MNDRPVTVEAVVTIEMVLDGYKAERSFAFLMLEGEDREKAVKQSVGMFITEMKGCLVDLAARIR